MSVFDPKKKKGKYFKKDSVLTSLVKLDKYSFEEIQDHHITFPDNLKGNIISHKLHTEEDLKEGVRKSEQIDKELETGVRRHKLLKPINFTEEWNNLRNQARRKGFNGDDEEDFEGLSSFQDAEPEAPKKVVSSEIAESLKVSSGAMPKDSDTKATIVSQAKEEIVKSESPDALDKGIASIDMMTQVIKDFSSATKPEFKSFSEINDDKTAPVIEKKSEEPLTVRAPDLNLEKLKEQAYQEGFMLGEAKAIEQTKSYYNQYLKILGEATQSINGLKNKVLEEANEQFFEIVQAVSEVLIGQELQMNLKSFNTFIKNVVEKVAAGEKCKVVLSQDAYDLIDQEYAKKLNCDFAVDPKLKKEEFRIERNQTNVEVNLSEAIKKLVKNAHQSISESLFESKDVEITEKKAS